MHCHARLYITSWWYDGYVYDVYTSSYKDTMNPKNEQTMKQMIKFLKFWLRALHRKVTFLGLSVLTIRSW